MSTRRRRAIALPVALAGAGLLLAGCAPAAAPSGVQVLASFYPLQYLVQQIGGDLVTVTSLTPPGAEPHDIELSPRQVREVGDADLVVYLSGFQAAVDQAIASRKPTHLVDAASVPTIAEHIASQDAAETTDTGIQARDPHFWLDPTLLAALAPEVASALSTADPAHADAYAAGATTLEASLAELDTELSNGLAQCERTSIVTSHAAFGYLAQKYHLTQVSLSGLDPEAEPSPARLREIRGVVQQYGVTTIFTETLVSPKVAETLAADLRIATAVLDPIESESSSGTDYRGAMEQNLAALRSALGCS